MASPPSVLPALDEPEKTDEELLNEMTDEDKAALIAHECFSTGTASDLLLLLVGAGGGRRGGGEVSGAAVSGKRSVRRHSWPREKKRGSGGKGISLGRK